MGSSGNLFCTESQPVIAGRKAGCPFSWQGCLVQLSHPFGPTGTHPLIPLTQQSCATGTLPHAGLCTSSSSSPSKPCREGVPAPRAVEWMQEGNWSTLAICAHSQPPAPAPHPLRGGQAWFIHLGCQGGYSSFGSSSTGWDESCA